MTLSKMIKSLQKLQKQGLGNYEVSFIDDFGDVHEFDDSLESSYELVGCFDTETKKVEKTILLVEKYSRCFRK